MKTLQEVGREFYAELVCHHFGCEWSEQNSSLISIEHETPKANPLAVAGGRFVTELLRRFHHDRSCQEVNQPGQTEHGEK